MPDTAIAAIENDSSGLLFKVMDLRIYANAKSVYDTSKPEDRPKGGVYELVSINTFKIAKERMKELEEKQRKAQTDVN